MSKQTVTHAHPSGSFWARNRKSGGYLLRKTVRRKGYQLIRFLLLFGLCFMIIQPLLDKLSVSFMAERDLYDSTVISIPRHLTTANYSLAASKILLNYGTTFLNTLIVSLAVSVLQIAACTLVGYGFARFEFPFKKFWFAAVIITVIIPPQTISSSLYLHFNFFDIFGIFKATTGSSLNLRGSPIPYALMSATCMGLKNGLYIYMIRQFFTGIPKSLEEAAYVDGCSIFKTFWRVILPDAVPILVSCFLFSFVWQWTDTFYSKLFLGNIKLLSLEASTVADRLNSYVSIQLGLSGAAAPLAPVGITDMTVVFIRTLRLIADRHTHASKEIIGIIEVIAPVHALHHVRREQQADAQLVQRILLFLVDNALVAPRGQIVHRRGVAHIVVDAEDSGVKAVVRAVHIHPIAEDMRLTVRDVLPCRQIRIEYLFHLFFSLSSLMMPF